MKYVLSMLSVVGVTLLAATASADEKGAITMKTTTVFGNPQRPAAAIEVSKVRMQLGATTPTLASVSKIHDAVKKDPF